MTTPEHQAGASGRVPQGDTAGITLTAAARLVEQLAPGRRSHSRAVSRRCTAAAGRYVPPWTELAELAGLVHDIGYATEADTTDFHPLDGADYLHRRGYDPLVCHLVATHAGAPFEHLARGGDLADFDRWTYHGNAPVAQLRSILAWADLTTGPDGATVTVTERLEEILSRYDHASPVAAYVRTARSWLEMAGTSPLASVDHDQLQAARSARGG